MQIPAVPDPRATALFLDIDGTLVEHNPRPDGIEIAPGLLETLDILVRHLDGALALVTGRSLAMVDRLFAPRVLPTAATFGIETRWGEVSLDGADLAAEVAPVFAGLEARFAARPGVYFEHKGPVLAIHTRAAPEALVSVAAACRDALDLLPAGYRAVAGQAGVELLPDTASKARAIAWFMASDPFRARRPVFLGDDTTDEVGFDWVNHHGGLSVRVKPEGPTAAQHGIDTVAGVHHWLAALAAAPV